MSSNQSPSPEQIEEAKERVREATAGMTVRLRDVYPDGDLIEKESAFLTDIRTLLAALELSEKRHDTTFGLLKQANDEIRAVTGCDDLDEAIDALPHTQDMANVGKAFMERIEQNAEWLNRHDIGTSWCNCPTELFTDMLHRLDELAGPINAR